MDNQELEEDTLEDEEWEEDTALEAKFRKTYDKVITKINSKLEEATKALRDAEKISEKYGVPFDSDISFLRQGYVPTSLSEKFPELDTGFISDLTGVYDEYVYDSGGWQHSQVCY